MGMLPFPKKRTSISVMMTYESAACASSASLISAILVPKRCAMDVGAASTVDSLGTTRREFVTRLPKKSSAISREPESVWAE